MNVIEVIIPEHLNFGRNINFNPSITHLHDNIFLVSFNSFRRGIGRKVIDRTPSVTNPDHVWYGGPGSYTWWNPDFYGFLSSGYMIVEIINNDINIKQIINTPGVGTDTRISMTPLGVLATTALSIDYDLNRSHGFDRYKYDLPTINCSDCGSIFAKVLNITYRNNIYSITNANEEGQLLCDNLGADDKNWSVFNVDNKIYLSYWLSPKHTVFIPEDSWNMCSAILEKNINIFYRIEKYYQSHVKFSLSTPAIMFDDRMLGVKGRMLGVGHVKIICDNITPGTPAHTFYLNNKDISTHPYRKTLYMMFFYTFNIDTFDILHVSTAFFPPTTQNGVVYPVGLEYFDDQYIISYGEGDSQMKFLFILPETIKEMLIAENMIPISYIFTRY